MGKSVHRVALFHPDLGIGGAGRLVVDTAVALNNSGNNVKIFTTRLNPVAYPETTSNIDVVVVKNGFSQTKSKIIELLRLIWAAMFVVFFGGFRPDVIFCDMKHICIPIFKMLSSAKVVFYCHFPDKAKRTSTCFYHRISDWIEEKCLGMADRVLVNSQFTSDAFRTAFPKLDAPTLVYPSVDVSRFDQFLDQDAKTNLFEEFTFLSINRFKRKKNVDLAIKAFAMLKSKRPEIKMRLIAAGGYEPLFPEHIQCHDELQNLAKELDIKDSVVFLKSPTEEEKISLLHRCHGLLYTPEVEHFGIVPLEAMSCRLPVVAAAGSGGPAETVVHGSTGFLLEPTAEALCEAMEDLIDGGIEMKAKIGEAGRKRVEEHFSFRVFTDKMQEAVAKW